MDNGESINNKSSTATNNEGKVKRKLSLASKKSAKGEEQDQGGQIHDVIGHFGYYQFLIFLFKILIGVVSAFNNLSVTFFAPSNFIGFECLDNFQASRPINLTNFNSSLLNDQNPSSLNVVNVQSVPPFQLIENHHTNNNNNNNHNKQLEYSNSIFHEFLFSQERKLKHQQGFDTDTPKNLLKQCEVYSPEVGAQVKCKHFKYHKGFWLSTIIDEWNLVCDRSLFISMTQSLYMFGFIISYLSFGYISDRFGRWNSLLIGAVIEISSGFGCAFANSISSFMMFRFFLGLGNAGRSSTSYLIMIEWVGPKWRMLISTLGALGWLVGFCSMPWISLYFLHFRHVQLFVCFYELLFVIWLLRLPESPRWLLTHKKFSKAREVLLMAAKFNGLIVKEKARPKVSSAKSIQSSSLNAKLKVADIEATTTVETIINNNNNNNNNNDEFKFKKLLPYTIEEFELKFKNLTHTIDSKDFTKNENNLSILDLFKWTNLRNYALVLYFVWMSNSFIYYGIVLRVGDFGGKNLFKTFTISGFTELPSIIFTILCMNYMPRKTTNLFLFITTGLLCSIQLPLKYYQYGWLQQTTILLAKLFNSCSFTVILYQTMELFPTSIRQTAYSSCSLAGRIGSILAPFIKELAQATNDSVPPVIYALLSVVAAFLIVELPETKGLDLPDTLLEAEKIKDDADNHHHHHHQQQQQQKNTNARINLDLSDMNLSMNRNANANARKE